MDLPLHLRYQTKFYRAVMVIPGPVEPTQAEMRAFLQPVLEELQAYGPGGGIEVTCTLSRHERATSESAMDIDGQTTFVRHTFIHTVFLTGVFADTPARYVCRIQ